MRYITLTLLYCTVHLNNTIAYKHEHEHKHKHKQDDGICGAPSEESKVSRITGTEQTPLRPTINPTESNNSEQSNKSREEIIKIEIHSEHNNKDRNILRKSLPEKQNIVNTVHSVQSQTLQPMIFLNNNSVSQISKTEHKLNQLMNEVLTQTPSTQRSSDSSNKNAKTLPIAKNTNNMVSPPPKSTHYTSHNTTTQHGRTSSSNLNNGARWSISDHRVTTTPALPRNNSIPMPSMGAQIFNKTQRKSISPSASTYDRSRENMQDMEKISIPRMGMTIGQSVKSPATYSKRDGIHTNHTNHTNDTNHETTASGNTVLSKYIADDDEDITVYNETNMMNMSKKESAMLMHHHGLGGQSSPTVGSGYSQNTGITSFQADNLNHASSFFHDGMDSLQLTLYDLDEDDHDLQDGDKKTLSYRNIYDDNFNMNNIDGMHNMKNMINSAIPLNDRSSDDYHTVHKGLRMEIQDSASFQSSILPLPF